MQLEKHGKTNSCFPNFFRTPLQAWCGQIEQFLNITVDDTYSYHGIIKGSISRLGGCETNVSAAVYDAVSEPFQHCDNLLSSIKCLEFLYRRLSDTLDDY